MNKRIRDLAEQAGFVFYDIQAITGEDDGEIVEAYKWQAAEKFAQLIAQECIEVCKSGASGSDFELADHAADRIQRHFGVVNENVT